MERNDGIIRWSPNPIRNEFMTINLNYRLVQMFEATGNAQPSQFDYQKTSKHNEFPSLNTYDWSPVVPGLVAMGTSRGEINLLRVDDDSNQVLTLPLKVPRPCQSVAFNTTGLLAVGLDRVRNDSCLQIWDLNQRLAGWNPKQPGWVVPHSSLEPRKVEASATIASIKFFEDQPQTLAVGVKHQSVRIHDLRDPNSVVINFQTRCNNNLAIDYADPNYFASTSLDQPGLVVWDRRVTSRSIASPMYLESVDLEEVPWGAALKLDRAIETEKNVYIRQLRFYREQRGTLGVLSGAGQFQVFHTNKEYVEPSSVNDIGGSPELLEVQKSHDLEYAYFNQDHKRRIEDRIVSFDWLNLGTSDLPGRVIALRGNGSFEVLQMPAPTSGQLSNLIPWKPPHRLNDPYLTLMGFKDPNERDEHIGPLFASEAKADAAVFGPERFTLNNVKSDLDSTVKKLLQSKDDHVINLLAPAKSGTGPDLTFPKSDTLSSNLEQLRLEHNTSKTSSKKTGSAVSNKVLSHIGLHDKSHFTSTSLGPSAQPKSDILDQIMLQRAARGYLFECAKNQAIVVDDPWLQDVWRWIKGAELAAVDDGMVSGPLDLSYMGVYTIWMNLLGEKAQSRLIDSTIIPVSTQWEHLIATLNNRANRAAFEGVPTAKPHHRQLCLAICGAGKSPAELDQELRAVEDEGKYTTAAAWALFEGMPQRAVEILKRGGKDLLFIAIALDIMRQSTSTLVIDTEEWNKALESHPQMSQDHYLRAIYCYITTGNWVAIADETALSVRDRVGIALRNFSDDQLSEWLEQRMQEAIRTGDIEGIVLAGITDNMVDILAKYVEKFLDYQTPILIMSFCYPRYIDDIRTPAWRNAYRNFLQRHKKFLLRVKFEQQSTAKSRTRDGIPIIKPPPRQVTIRCLNCDALATNDLANTGEAPALASGPTTTTIDNRNPLAATGINAGLCCPKCGSHLARCAICMETVGMPRSDRPGQSNDPAVRRMANFPTFCLKCKHVSHMDHSVAWFSRHVECPVPECNCQCNERLSHREID